MWLGRITVVIGILVTMTLQAASAEERIVVFVPGLLGSALTVDGQPAWGQTDADDSRLAYDPEQLVHAETLEQFFIARLFGLGRVIYGELMTEMNADLSAPERFVSFGYDWRASNAESARSLHAFLCEQASKGPIVLAAHSMDCR